MALCRQIIDLIRPDLPDQPDKAYGISQITVAQMKMFPSLQMRDALPVIHGRAPHHAVYLIAFFQ